MGGGALGLHAERGSVLADIMHSAHVPREREPRLRYEAAEVAGEARSLHVNRLNVTTEVILAVAPAAFQALPSTADVGHH